MNREQHIGALIRLSNQYDPENDYATPAVSSTEMALVIVVNHLLESITDLEDRVQELENMQLEQDGY